MSKNIDQDIAAYLESRIRTIPDFPKQGIQFKDITPLIADSRALELAAYMLVQPYIDKHVDYVLGLESRGFILGPAIASRLHSGFIPVRKEGKLPYRTRSVTYELEYGRDTLEMHEDAIAEGDNVLIHDDLMATGGSAAAASELVEKAGARTVGFSFLLEITALEGRKKLKKNEQIHTVIPI